MPVTPTVAKTVPERTLSSADIAEAAKMAAERVGLSEQPTAKAALEALIGYLSESKANVEGEREEGELMSESEGVSVGPKSFGPKSLPPTKITDPCVRRPTRPSKVFAPKPKPETSCLDQVQRPPTSGVGAKPKKLPPSKIAKLRTDLTPFIPKTPTDEQAEHARRRTKTVSTRRLVRQAVKLDLTAAAIADKFTVEYSLKADERRRIIREVRVARMAQRYVAKDIRKMQWNIQHEGRKEFVRTLDMYLSELEEHSNESDEQ